MGYQVRIIQHGGSNLIITKHASTKMLIHTGSTARGSKWQRLREIETERREGDWGKPQRRERERAESGVRDRKQLKQTRERNEEVKEKRVSVLAAQLRRRKIEMREQDWAGERERATQAKCLKWITVGQTSEEDKTANMSHCSLLAFNNRCLVSPSPVIVPHPGWSDLVNK